MYLSQINSQLSISLDWSDTEKFKKLSKKTILDVPHKIYENSLYKIKGLINWSEYSGQVSTSMKTMLIDIAL